MVVIFLVQKDGFNWRKVGGFCAARIKHGNEQKQYEQKQAEGKPKMLALNNVKFKLINCIFAVIQRGTLYVKTQQFTA